MIRGIATSLIALAGLAAAIAGCRGEPGARSLAEGGQAYLAQCAVCHGVKGEGDGPLVSTLAADGKPRLGPLDRSKIAALGRDGVIRLIGSGVHQRGGSTMPLWGPYLGESWTARIADYVLAAPAMGEAEDALVSAYLGSAAGEVAPGRRTYVMYCSGCHGPQGKGDGFFSPRLRSSLQPKPLHASALAGLDDNALDRLIGLDAGHASAAATMPGWLHLIPEGERAALRGYLRQQPAPSAP